MGISTSGASILSLLVVLPPSSYPSRIVPQPTPALSVYSTVPLHLSVPFLASGNVLRSTHISSAHLAQLLLRPISPALRSSSCHLLHPPLAPLRKLNSSIMSLRTVCIADGVPVSEVRPTHRRPLWTPLFTDPDFRLHSAAANGNIGSCSNTKLLLSFDF